MTRGFSPVIQRNWAHVDANTVSSTDIPVDCYVCSMNPKLQRRLNRSPNFVSVMFTNDLSFALKLRVYGQKSHQLTNGDDEEY